MDFRSGCDAGDRSEGAWQSPDPLGPARSGELSPWVAHPVPPIKALIAARALFFGCSGCSGPTREARDICHVLISSSIV